MALGLGAATMLVALAMGVGHGVGAAGRSNVGALHSLGRRCSLLNKRAEVQTSGAVTICPNFARSGDAAPQAVPSALQRARGGALSRGASAAAATSSGTTAAATAFIRGGTRIPPARVAAGHQAHCSAAHWACRRPQLRPPSPPPHPRLRGTVRRASSSASAAAAASSSSKAMEVEVKLRLPDKAAYDKVAALLAPGKRASYAQDNYFFDGDKCELESKRAVMRLRFYDVDAKAVITVKGKQLLVDGIGRASEVEEEVEAGRVKEARAQWLEQPHLMVEASPLLQKLNKEWGIERVVCLGGFSNHRTEYVWTPPGKQGEGGALTLELDATGYEWGTLYEIECETTEPEAVRDHLKAMLEAQGIPFSYSATSKFANFINKSLL